eukprot:SAG11_NODE_1040_length_6065_cov_2.701307_3_plen_90_part_00
MLIWALFTERHHITGQFFDLFTQLGDFSFLERDKHYQLPEWDLPDSGLEAAALSVQVSRNLSQSEDCNGSIDGERSAMDCFCLNERSLK